MQTYRQEGQLIDDDLGDVGKKPRRAPATFTQFVRVVQDGQERKFILTDAVLTIIQRQIDALTSAALKRSAQKAAETRRARKAK